MPRGGGDAVLRAPPARDRCFNSPAPTSRPRASSRPFLADYIGEFELVDDHRSGKIVVDVRTARGRRAPARLRARARRLARTPVVHARPALPAPSPQLIGRINKCGVISPRFDVTVPELEKWINNLLPSRSFGHIVLTTSLGIIDHDEARRKHTGGKVLGFFY